MRWIGRLLFVTALTTIAISAFLSGPAKAGGSWLYPVADRYEPGDTATLVGYSGNGGAYGSIDDGPFYGYLFKLTENGGMAPRAIPLPLGELEVARTEHRGHLANRAAITFEIPDWVRPGTYFFDYCSAGCEERLGELIGAYVYVGIDPEFPIERDWARDEPEILNLVDDARLTGPGYSITAGELRERGPSARLSEDYVRCVRGRGFNGDLGAQVLLNAAGVPYHVKTSPEVAGRYHGPCLAAIGGPETAGSSWSVAGLCALPMAPSACANAPG